MDGIGLVYITSAVLMAMAFVVLTGKGDFLISGYDAASKEEKAKFDIRRLRLLIFCLLAAVSLGLPFVLLMGWGDVGIALFSAIVVLLSVICVVLSHTWARKK